MFLNSIGGILENKLGTSKEISLVLCGKGMTFIFLINSQEFVTNEVALNLQYSTISSIRNREILTDEAEI